uniref:uncharacterized protein si:ch211-176l24.4 n=1 Tax=Scatophagus argus TaxID=75038 RepID=UPI001ED81712|nr:uncharacterized protein si:ch211-176l24.4 [Scatophagus argus]
MSDCEETGFFWESWISPGKRKRKKDSKKCPDHKNDMTVKTEENIRKKKKNKNSKFKEAMVRRKSKKKDKKKNRSALELGDSFVPTQACSAQAKPTVKPESSNSHIKDKLKPDHLTQDSKKKIKRKKKVAFNLSPGYICAKRPEFVSSSQHCSRESIHLESEAVRDSGSCSRVTVTRLSQGPTHNNDSQCTSEDVNSQDLFITQKTFRASPSELSSSDTSDRAFTSTPQVSTHCDKLRSSMAQTKQLVEGSYKDLHVQQHHRKTNEHPEKTEQEDSNKVHHKHMKGKCQTQMQLNTNLTEEEKVLCPVYIKPSVNPYLAEPIVENPCLDVAKSKKHSCTSSSQSMKNTSTQTENFFSTELSSYLNFCQKCTVTAHFKDLKALDLSLPHRSRRDLGSCLSVNTKLSLTEQMKGDNHQDNNLHPSCSSGIKEVEVKKEDQHPCSVSTQSKGETTLSPQSGSEPKSADTTTSSEDNEPPCRTTKLDLAQVRAVQMRLNESFFFRTKGEGRSPRPESPLMKVTWSRDVKSRKGR